MEPTTVHELDATALLAALRRGELSSVDIVEALIARRAAVDGQIGAFVVKLDAQARAEARAADEARARGGELGPLHGLPLTIKDNIDVRGTDSTLGLRSRMMKPAASDAVVVGELRKAGAIVLGKTNVPQLLLVQESDNAVFGVTRNPFHPERSPGGSSGGEAAALASGQTPLGIGTDIGGSIRIPAHFCGVCGLKPTVDRWSTRGMRGGIDGQEIVRAQMGPMARTVRDLALLMTTLDPRRQWRADPAVPPLPVEDPAAVRLGGLRIGVCEDDGYLTPAPAIQRAVRRAAAVLADAGATIVPYQPPDPQELIYLWLAAISSDGGATLRQQLAADPVCRQLRPMMYGALLPTPARLVLARVLSARGEERQARLLRSIGEKAVADLWRLTAQRTALRRKEFDAWDAHGLDAVLLPPHVLPAMPLGTSGDLTLTLTYMFRYVFLNFPAGVVPVTRVRPEETSWAGPAPLDGLSRRCAEVVAGSAGLPVGVQVAARPYREDLALAVMAAIEAGVRADADFPRTPVDPVPGPIPAAS
jgi:fatty acid amide hydrolase